MKQLYVENRFQQRSLHMIHRLNSVIDEYIAQGYKLTVRQLYYQCVSRDWIPNTERSYKQLASLINDARLAGEMDWDAIEDRTREFAERSRWRSPQSIVSSAAMSYHEDMWSDQRYRVFLVVEKEALAGVFERVCHEYDVPMLAARGYPSISVLREFAESNLVGAEQENILLHFGDHDPSGIDMTRDLSDRLRTLSYGVRTFELRRIALNMDQVRKQKPPPNPAKVTDSRFVSYRERFGSKSWELDALNPQYLSKLATDAIEGYINFTNWEERREEIAERKGELRKIASNYDKIIKLKVMK